MPRQTFMHRAVATAPLPDVWRSLQRPEVWARIGGVSRVDHPTFDDAGGLTGYRFAIEVGGTRHVGVATRSSSQSRQRMVMDIDSDQVQGRITVALDPVEDGTAVTLDMTIESKGILAAMLFPVIARAVASGFNQAVEQFVKDLGGEHESP